MNAREVSEIRRRFRADKSNITHVRGCYVNERKEIISEFHQSMALLSQAESEELLAILKRTLSGSIGRNLVDITFDTKQVVSADEHRLLMALRSSGLNDIDAVHTFYQKVIESLNLETNYLILLTEDSYDIPYRAKDGENFDDGSTEVYHYILCSICPVKATKVALSFQAHENAFRNLSPDWIISPPELGFLFPSFDDRSTNLYNALYYTKNAGENYRSFVDAVFNAPILMPAKRQKETFQDLLGESLEEECRCEVVQSVRDQLCALIEEHKQSRDPHPLVISKSGMQRLITGSGVSDERAQAFSQRYDESFGADTALSPRNLVDSKTEIRTADVRIQISSERSDLVETRMIDGVRYVLIRVEDSVEVNGVPIQID